jgi:HAMP domain-containing protein
LATLAVAVVLVTTGVALVAQQRSVLIEQLDEAIAADADRLVDELGTSPTAADLVIAGDDDAVAQLMTPSGDVVASSPNLAVTSPLGEIPDGVGDVFATSSSIGTDDVKYRVLSRLVPAADGRTFVIHIASPRDDIDETVGALVVSLSATVPIVTGVLAMLIWVLVGRTLRPVERIRAEVAEIGRSGLDRRVPRPPGRDEIARLATTMNEMLDRLEVSMRSSSASSPTPRTNCARR